MKNKRIALTIMTLLLLLLIGIGATFAWFINFGTNKVEGTEVSVSAGNVMEISLDNTNFASSQRLDAYRSTLNMQDITGDGNTFLRPALIQAKEQIKTTTDEGTEITYEVGVANPDNTAQWRAAISTADCVDGNYATADYIRFQLYFRANAEMDIYLSSDSSVTPVNPDGNDSAYAADGNRFSKDWIAAASRVAFVDSENKVKMVWAPLSNTKLFYDNGFQLKHDGESETYKYLKKVDGQNKYETIQYTNVNGEQGNASTPIYTEIKSNPKIRADNEVPVARLTRSETNEYYEGSVTVSIWIEGSDREARRALAGGKINASLVFVGFETQNT